jgi:hypothetical protein
MDVEAQIAQAAQGAQEEWERPTPALRVALPVVERRVLLVIGDALLVNGAVLVAPYLWVWLAGNAFGLAFVRSRWF